MAIGIKRKINFNSVKNVMSKQGQKELEILGSVITLWENPCVTSMTFLAN